MNYYFKKRKQNNIKRSDMASELGIDYNRYLAIEKGDVKMPLNLINKFNEIINRGKENEIVGLDNTIKANEFWDQVCQKDKDGRWVLVSKMREFNIKNYQQLAHLLGYKSVGTIYNYLNGINNVGDEFKKRLYNFFNDETNIQIPKKTIKKQRAKEVNKELDDYYNNTDFKGLFSANNLYSKDVAEAVNLNISMISRVINHRYKPTYETLQKIKDFLDTFENKDNIIKSQENKVVSHDKYISKQMLIDQCQKEIDENKAIIEDLQQQISQIQEKIELSAKVLDIVAKL